MTAFRDFARRPGWEIDFKRVGYLFVFNRPEDLAAFEASVALQHECGLDTRILSADQARAVCPLLKGTTFLPRRSHPATATRRPRASSRATRPARAVSAPTFGRHRGAGDLSILAGSPAWSRAMARSRRTWSSAPRALVAPVGEMVGVSLPVTPLRRQILFTDAIDGLPADLPMTIDFESSFYFHREGPGLLMGMSDENEEPGFSIERTEDWIPELMEVVRSYFS